MNSYRFTGRMASFFRETDNAWASSRVISETVGQKSNTCRGELDRQMDFGHVERRGKRGAYEYRWNPETLYLENAKEPR